MKNSKKAYLLLTTSFILIFIALTIGAYVKYSSNISSQEFYKDLATIRGYWAVYGAKELNGNFSIPCNGIDSNEVVYEIDAISSGTGGNIIFKWKLVHKKGTITNDSIYRRTLITNHKQFGSVWFYYPDEILTYKLEGN